MKALSPDPCENCGGEVFSTVRKDGKPRKQRYCGLKCGAAYRKEKERGQAWHRLEYEIARIQSKRRRWYWRRCKWCSEWYSPGRDRGTCCSTKCAAYVGANTAGRIGRITDGSTHYHMMQREIGAIQRIGTMQRELRERGSLVKTCNICGKVFSGVGKVCSGECRAEHARRRGHAMKQGAGVKCIACSTHFCKVRNMATARNVCSDECSDSVDRREKRRWKAKYRAQRQSGLPGNELFDPFEIFRRDRWKCQACGIDTPEKIRGTNDPDSPELDHIIPLSRGGWHAPDNVQTLCRSCNGDKWNQLPSEWQADQVRNLELF